MAAIILGGAPGANWTPLLLPVIAFFLLIASIDLVVRFIKRKLHHHDIIDETGNNI
jgi:hypothetical protein